MKMYSWQKDALKKGLRQARFRFIGMARNTDKSMTINQILNTMKFNSNVWYKWEKSFTIWPRRSLTGNWIWGKIMVRRNIFVIHDDGTKVLEYASCKEAFMDNLKNG